MAANIERRLVDEKRNVYHCFDDYGNVSKYLLYKGYRFTCNTFQGDVQDKMDKLAEFPCRNDDILLMTLPKTGSHWLTNIVYMLVNDTSEYIQTSPILEYVDHEPLKSLPSPRVLISHVPFKLIPKGFKTTKSKIICIYRNPKDTLVSLYCFGQGFKDEMKWYIGDWKGHFNFYLSKDVTSGDWFEHIKMWDQVKKEYPDKQILFVSYEDMKKHLYDNVVKISNFLEIERSEELYREIERVCTFSFMKDNINKGKEKDPNFAEMTKTGFMPIYRKGEIGDWKNWFTVAQNEIFDAVYEEQMKDYDISNIYTPTYA